MPVLTCRQKCLKTDIKGSMSAISSITQPVIVQIVPRLEQGGVERGTIEMAEAIQARGWKAVVISNGGKLTSQLKRVGAISYEIPVHSKNPLKWPSIRHKVRRILQQESADIVHVRSRVPAWIGLSEAKYLGIASVATIHSKFVPSNVIKHIYNRKILQADRVIAISDYVRDNLLAHYKNHISEDKITVIHRGVDLSLFDPAAVNQRRIIAEAERVGAPDDGKVVMLAARPTAWKGYEVLIDAVASLDDKTVSLVLVGAGSGEIKFIEKLRARAVRTGLGGRLRIAEASIDMPAALMLADVVAMPSIHPEPFGRIALEAQAMGRPVVAFAHGGAIESILPDKTGWLASPCKTDELAQALNNALSLSAASRQKLAKQARDQVSRYFSKQQMCDKTMSIYQSLLDAD